MNSLTTIPKFIALTITPQGYPRIYFEIAQSDRAVEYTDCFSEEG